MYFRAHQCGNEGFVNVTPVGRQLQSLLQGDFQSSLQLLGQLRDAALTLWMFGTTAQRPINPVLSQLYFDTTLGAFVYCSAVRNGAIAAVWSTIGMTTPIAGTTFAAVTAAGAFALPASPAWANAIEFVMQAAGGSTVASNATGAVGGAGSGEYMHRIIPITPSTVYSGVVGAAVANSNGGNTTFTGDGGIVFTALGGGAGGLSAGGTGGGRLGGAGGVRATPGGVGGPAALEGIDAISGAGGGGPGSISVATPGGAAGPCEERAGSAGGNGAGGLPGGGAGAPSRFGAGPAGGNVNAPGVSPAADAWGAGASGPGAGTQAGALGILGVFFYRFV
jgi:hypothetical protein